MPATPREADERENGRESAWRKLEGLECGAVRLRAFVGLIISHALAKQCGMRDSNGAKQKIEFKFMVKSGTYGIRVPLLAAGKSALGYDVVCECAGKRVII